MYENGPREGGENPRRARLLGFGRQHGGHALAFHRRGLFNFGEVGQLLQNRDDDPSPFVNVLQLPTPKEHVDQDLILVLKESPRLVNLGLDVVVAGLGAHADLFQLLLVWLALALVPLSRLLITELAVIQYLADRRPFQRCDFDQVQLRFCARSKAWAVGTTPNCSPLTPISRTGLMRICSLTL